MRLIDIYNTIQENYEIACGNTLKSTNPTTNSVVLSGQVEMISALEKLEKIPSLKPYIDSLKNTSSIYNATLEQVRCSSGIYNDFQTKLNILKTRCEETLLLIKDIIGTQPENMISVKLPTLNNLSKLADYIKTIEKLLEQLVCNEMINGKVELDKVDSGSIWLDIALGASSAVFIVGSAAWAAAVIRKKFLEGNVVIKQLEAMGFENGAIASVKETLDKELERINNMEVENILSQTGFEFKNEYKQRCLYVVKELYKLILEGVEIYPVNPPEEVKNLFPNFKNLNLIESKIPKLNESNSDNDSKKDA